MLLTQKRTTKLFLILLALIVALAAFQVGVTYAQAEDEGGERQNPLCTDPEAKPHPVLATIAERYGVDYQQLVDWKCDENYGVGEMLAALQTSGLIDADASALLGKKGKGKAWGKIWKEAGLIGSEADAGPPPWAQNNKNNPGGGPPDHANGQGQGKPDDAGKPDDGEDGDDGDGPGNGNGPPAHANNDKDKPENENKGDDDDDDEQSLTCESGLVLDGDTVEDVYKLADEYDVAAFEIIAQLCGGDSLNDVEDALEGDD